MELKKLDLDDLEKLKISKIAKQNKFPNAKINILYEDDPEKQIKIVINCFRFLRNLSNQEYFEQENIDSVEGSNESNDEKIIDKNKISENEIKEKIIIFLDNIKEIEKEALILKSKIPNINYGSTESLSNIKIFVIKNYEQLVYLIDFVYELGKIIEQYDPADIQGYY